MNRPALLIAAIAVVSVKAFAADATFERTFPATGATTVSVSTGSGYIHAFGADNQVHIVGHVHSHPGWFGGDADSRVKQIAANPPIEQSGNSVTIGSRHGDSELYQNISIDYDISVPPSAALNAHTGSGELKIGGIGGAVTGSSGSGDIQVENIGPGGHLQTGSGSIHATNVHGTTALQTGSGNLHLDLTSAGDVHAQTGSGSIHIEGLSGALTAHTGSGSIEVTGNPTADSRLETGSGSIRFNMPTTAHFSVSAETGSGSIHVDQPMMMQGEINKHHVSGAVNGGGPTLHVHTGSGDIVI
jgi:hypothetical protein